jgi:hypothetical protein
MSVLDSVAGQLPRSGALTTAAYLRIASLAIAAYEYVVSHVLVTFVITQSQPVFSSPSRQNIVCTSPLIEGGRKLRTSSRR